MTGGVVGSSYIFYLQLVDVNGIQFTEIPADMPEPYISVLNMDPALVSVVPGVGADSGRFQVTVSSTLEVARRYTVLTKLCGNAADCPDGSGSTGYNDVKNTGVLLQMRPAAANAGVRGGRLRKTESAHSRL